LALFGASLLRDGTISRCLPFAWHRVHKIVGAEALLGRVISGVRAKVVVLRQRLEGLQPEVVADVVLEFGRQFLALAEVWSMLDGLDRFGHLDQKPLVVPRPSPPGPSCMLGSTVMPEAYEEGGPVVGLVTSASFLLAFILSRLE